MPEQLARLFAFPVFPRQEPQGGSVPITPRVEQGLEEAYTRGKVNQGLAISLMVDTGTRTNDVRDALITAAFEEDRLARNAAQLMADRLADAMDLRSTAGLLILSVHGDGATREVVLWIFPQDEAFRFERADGRERIELLDDIFSMSSYLRKAASFRGRNLRTGFLSGRVVDFQANAADRYVADFWVERFLQARLEMSGDEGTQLFGKAIKQAFDRLGDDVAAKEELAAGISLIRNRVQRLSLRSFADNYLTGQVAEAVIQSAPNPQAVDALFDFRPERFEEVVRFRVFHLNDGTMVTTPIGSVGETVNITEDGNERTLEARGVIVDESVRARRG